MKKRQILALLLVCVMMVGLLPVTPASATEASDPLDVVIVFDRSSAMDEDILTCTENHTHSTGALSGCYETRMAVAKRTAKDLITEIIDQNDNAKVAIVTFAKEATVAYHLTSVKTILRSTINVTTKSHKAANIEAGLVTATNYLQENGRAGSRRAIVLVSAGQAKYYNDPLDELTLGTGLLMTSICTEQTLDQAHLTRDFGMSIYSVGIGVNDDSPAEQLLLAAQDQGYYTNASANAASSIAAGLAAGDDPFDVAAPGSTWTVGFAKESLLPDGVPFMSYKVEDLPATGLLYSRDILNEDLSFDPDDLPPNLKALVLKLNAMQADPNRYPSAMVKTLSSFINRVLPIDPPFSPDSLLANSATFASDLAAFNAQFGAAETALTAGTADVLAAAAARYVEAGSTQEAAEAAAAQNFADFLANGSSADAQLDADYQALLSEINGMELTDYTPEATQYYMAGFELDWSCLGYLDAPYVRAAYIDDNTGRGGIILVSVETIGMARADINRIRDRLAPFIHENGIREVHILSAHNHSTIDTMGIWGPMLEDGKDDAYMEQVMTSICDVSVAAYHARKTGSLYVGTVDAGEQTGYPELLVEDRRYPTVTDNAEIITRFRFAPSDGSNELYIVHFGTHLEALQEANRYISADFLDPFQDYLDTQNNDADFMFFTGAIGGLIRTNRYQTLPSDFTPRNEAHKHWRATQLTGKRTGELVCSITAADEIELAPKLNTVSTVFEAELDNFLLALLAQLNIINTRTYIKDLDTGLRNTHDSIASLQTLGSAAANALTTYLRLLNEGTLDQQEILVQTLIGFADTYYQVVSDNLANIASSEMHYFEFYQKDGDRIKGLILMPGEIFPELVYGGMLEGGTGDYYKDPHNPDAEPIDLLVDIAEATGRDFGDNYEDLIVLGQANDMMGYIVTPNDWLLHPTLPYISQYPQGSWRHHYEETNSAGPDTAYVIADTFRELIGRAN